MLDLTKLCPRMCLAGTNWKDRARKCAELGGELFRALQRHIVDRFFEPAHPGIGVQLEHSLHARRLARQKLGRVLRPDIQTGLPSFYGHDVATLPLAVLWVAVAVFLGALGYVTGRRPRTVSTSAL